MNTITQIAIILAALAVAAFSIYEVQQVGDLAKTAFQSLDQAGEDLSELSTGMQGFVRAEGIRSTLNLINWFILTLFIVGAMIVVRRDSRKDSKTLAAIQRTISRLTSFLKNRVAKRA